MTQKLLRIRNAKAKKFIPIAESMGENSARLLKTYMEQKKTRVVFDMSTMAPEEIEGLRNQLETVVDSKGVSDNDRSYFLGLVDQTTDFINHMGGTPQPKKKSPRRSKAR